MITFETIQIITMNKGTVKFLMNRKDSFIIEEGTNKEYFVHVSGLIDGIEVSVEFELTEGRKA